MRSRVKKCGLRRANSRSSRENRYVENSLSMLTYEGRHPITLYKQYVTGALCTTNGRRLKRKTQNAFVLSWEDCRERGYRVRPKSEVCRRPNGG